MRRDRSLVPVSGTISYSGEDQLLQFYIAEIVTDGMIGKNTLSRRQNDYLITRLTYLENQRATSVKAVMGVK